VPPAPEPREHASTTRGGTGFSLGDVATTAEIYERLGAHFRWQKLRELERVLHRRGVEFAQLNNERLCPQLVTRYLAVKRRQLI
jgi:uncharacterized protein (DUF58 family)